jgi:hypothetical protein
MVTKTKRKASRNEYLIRGVKGRKTIDARNMQEAVNKASRLYPRSKLLGVERIARTTNREYETTWINR